MSGSRRPRPAVGIGPTAIRVVVLPLAGIAALALMIQLGGGVGPSWAAAPPIAVAALGGLIIPGWSIAQAWGLRGVTALGAAPAITAGILTVGSTLAQPLGIPWDRAHLLIGPVGWLWAACAAAGLLARRAPLAPGTAGRPSGSAHLDTRGRAALCAGLGLAALMTAVPVIRSTGALDSPMQASDSIYHLSATAFVRLTGDASSLGGTWPLYDGQRIYYPMVWHAIAALLPGGVIEGSNTLVVVLSSAIWPLSMAALLRETLRRAGPEDDRGAGVLLGLGTALSGSVVSVLLLLTSVWPYALSVCLLPGCLALVTRVCGSGALDDRPRAHALAPAVLGALGVIGAHGAAAFNLIVLAGPLVAHGLWGPVSAAWRRGGRGRGALIAAATAGGLLVAGAGWRVRGSLVDVFSYRRPPSNLAETVYALATDHPLLARFSPYIPGNALVLALALTAVIGAWRGARGSDAQQVRLWSIGTGAAALILLLAAGPQWPLRVLAGPWYTQRARIIVLVTIGLLVLATLGTRNLIRAWRPLTGWRGRLASTPQRMALTVLAISLVLAPAWRWGLKAEIMEAVHDPERISYGTMLSDAELTMIRRAPQELGADALVIGNPSNGSAYLWSAAGVRTVYPTRLLPISPELEWLGEHLDQLGSDPEVCRILNERGVTHYYSDDARPDGATGGGRQPLWGRRMDQVPHEHLERVDSAPSGAGSTATLWRITACG
ncbi:hypothetical protein SAMN05216246_10180 [Actinomyces denticolens]|uniref:4-amino-4-deoxy-L-arabinose transferase n=1 Tax=Actinomyces denticolens TaxID=52767 RepID=A0ABY1I0S8_9ACTO|nr:DUF6541 family protein [Actinomyces denticolens]SHI29029.1 hypothetical protein SAMN05216246_10180 [Actinomyces denticolens]